MRLVVTLGDVELEFTEIGADGPYPWLVQAGPLLLSAIAGHLEGIGVTEAANTPAIIDNEGRQASRLLDFPISAPATLYDDSGDELFSGLIATATFGRVLELSIEA